MQDEHAEYSAESSAKIAPQAELGMDGARLETPLPTELARFLRYQAALGQKGLAFWPTWAQENECKTRVAQMGGSAKAEAEIELRAKAEVVRAAEASRKPKPQEESAEQKESLQLDSWEKFENAADGCMRCPLSQHRTHIVLGAGARQARLMFVGEGPGRDEDLQGEPFVGLAGQLLDRMIRAMGLLREDVYIANVVKCRPPRNRDPKPLEVAACAPFLSAQIDLVAPEVIVTLGRYASQTLLEKTTPISKLRGRWAQLGSIAVMPTFHPAYLLRSPHEKRKAWSDLQAVMQRLGLPQKTA